MFLGSNLADTSKDAYVPKRITISVVITRLRKQSDLLPLSLSPSPALSFPLCSFTRLPSLTFFFFVVVLPTVGIATTYLVIRLGFLPDDTVLHFLVMIQFAMPSAVNLILACQVWRRDREDREGIEKRAPDDIVLHFLVMIQRERKGEGWGEKR
jgi:hypothetical protein